MASSVNKAILVGNVGADPKIHSFKNGGRVCNFTVATNEKYKDRDGELVTQVDWHNIAVYGDKLIDIVWKNVHKGR